MCALLVLIILANPKTLFHNEKKKYFSPIESDVDPIAQIENTYLIILSK